nr:MAG TPA: hypothetical protein [Caudoviricetes sp.]
MTNTKLIIATLIAVPFVCAVGVFAGIASADRSANDYAADNQRMYEAQKAENKFAVTPDTLPDWPGFPAPATRNIEADAFAKVNCGWFDGADKATLIKVGIQAEASRANVSSQQFTQIRSMNEHYTRMNNILGRQQHQQLNSDLILGVIETTYDLIKSGVYKDDMNQANNYMYQLCEKRVYDAVVENNGSVEGLKFYVKK